MFGFWLLILLLIFVVFSIPAWPYSRGWGYYPAVIALVLLAIWVMLIWWGYVVFYYPWAYTPP